ncbi:MAG: Ldh family oxidoreductase, partial [Verrucomicrobia bacterium]|nr:Ldh family oxidoreductase [Verrucomicrobiota bacterium]
MPKFNAADLKRYVVDLFEAAKASSQEARIVAEHLVGANLAGVDSHGVLRVPQYVSAMQTGKVKLGVRPQVVSESESTAVIDGCDGFGQVVCNEAMTLAVNKALKRGIAAVTVRNSYHSGCIALYTKRAATKGLIAIATVNAGGGGQSMVPFGGLARRLATNPLSIAAPSLHGHPVVLDIATSVAPEGKIRDYYQNDKSVPVGWITNSEGLPTTDPKDFYKGGALLPLGGTAGYKGFGLAFMIDILAGALSGAGCCRADPPDPKDGLLMVAIDIKRFIPLE